MGGGRWVKGDEWVVSSLFCLFWGEGEGIFNHPNGLQSRRDIRWHRVSLAAIVVWAAEHCNCHCGSNSTTISTLEKILINLKDQYYENHMVYIIFWNPSSERMIILRIITIIFIEIYTNFI